MSEHRYKLTDMLPIALGGFGTGLTLLGVTNYSPPLFFGGLAAIWVAFCWGKAVW